MADKMSVAVPALFGDAGLLPTECRVVIVDDVEANVALLERILQSAGVTNVEGFVDPRAAISACIESCPDVLLLDLHMPHINGVDLIRELRGLLAPDEFLPVIVLTADTTADAKGRALAGGATDFLTKPFDRNEVLLRVRNLVELRGLYTRMQQHNRLLHADLDQQRSRQRQLAAERRATHDRITAVLGDPSGLRMAFQPIVELTTGQLVGTEALARFDHLPERSPDLWFAEAATVGLGTALELRAIDLALAQLPPLPPEAFLALNVSPDTATSSGLRERLAVFPGQRVVLELTEHEQVYDYSALFSSFDELRGQGVRIAVDDAGAGFAGLQHILQLHPDIVKLDKELTRDIANDPVRRALVTALVGFTAEMGADLLAEGIEDRDSLDTLRDLGVGWGQGYHLGHPGPLPTAATVDERSVRP